MSKRRAGSAARVVKDGRMMNLARSRLIPLVVLAAASVAPAASRAQAASTPAPAAASSGRAVTPDMLATMIKLSASIGMDSQLPAPIAAALGFSTAGQPWPDRQFAVQSNATGTVHAVALSRGSDPDIVLSVRGPAAISVFRVRRDGALVSAVNFFTQTKQTAPLSPLEARSGYEAECVFWVTNLDHLAAGN
jgi:hypothetical protein